MNLGSISDNFSGGMNSNKNNFTLDLGMHAKMTRFVMIFLPNVH